MAKKDAEARTLAKEGAPNANTTNGFSGDNEAVGPYQFVRQYHEAAVKKRMGLSWDEFKNSKEAQKNYYDNVWYKETLEPGANKYLAEVRKTFPNATKDDVVTMLHFGGEDNLQKAIKNPAHYYRQLDFLSRPDVKGNSLASYSGMNSRVVKPDSGDGSYQQESGYNPWATPLLKPTQNVQPVKRTPTFNMMGVSVPNAIAPKPEQKYPEFDMKPVYKPQRAMRPQGSRFNANDAAAFTSNIANMFTRLPAPPKPEFNSPIAMKMVNLDNDRNEITRSSRAADIFAEQQLDPQAAAQMKAFNTAQRIGEMSKVNQNERNTNIGISNDQQKVNAGIAMQNLSLKRDYSQQLFDRNLAQQRLQQENLANASDKYMAIQDRKAAERSANFSTELQAQRDYYGYWAQKQAELDAQKKSGVDVRRNGGIISNNYGAGAMFKMNFRKLSK